MNEPLFHLQKYSTPRGKQPYTEWLSDLRDRNDAALIRLHVDRLAMGYFGNSRFVGEGVWELKIHDGLGYRVYYLRDAERIILLLFGGDKGSQERDIRRAKSYADDYWRRK